jgi:hypothetical protein
MNMSKSSETSAEMCRRKADECRHGAAQARSPDEKANWLQVAEEWQAVAEKIDVTNAAPQERKNLFSPRIEADL